MATGNGSGFLEVGTNEGHEVVVNLPRDMTGHLVFSPQQARDLAATLERKAADAEQAKRDAAEAVRIASLPPVDWSQLSTTNGRPVAEVRRSQAEQGNVGQHDGYIVLSDAERAKGWVRPYRDSYKHVGERPKYPTRELTADEHERYDRFGYVAFEPYPDGSPESNGGSVSGRYWTQAALRSGCGTVTTMGRSLSETYARAPKFYGSTFCVTCNAHYPVAEFVWIKDGQVVGS